MLVKVVLCLIISGPAFGADHSSRILGGQKAESGQFPYIAGLYPNFDKNSNFDTKILPTIWCTAAIIDEDWAIIPAHCVVDLDPILYWLVAGTNVLFTDAILFNVSSVVIHPDYNYTGLVYLNDVALLQVETPFTISSNISTIEIGGVPPNQLCTIMGWGQLADSTYPNELYFTQMVTIDDQQCQDLADLVPYPIHLGADEVCTLSPDGISVPCNADAGPLICDGKVVAVLSYAIYGCEPRLPVVYTKLAYHEEWIQSVIKK